MLGAILLGTVPYLLIARHEAQITADNHRDREEIASAVLTEAKRENTEGFALRILCDAQASETFAAEAGTITALSENAAKRNAHLCVETGIDFTVVVTDDFVKTAKADILSGDLQYNLYAADAAGSLSALLSAGYLADVSDSVYIRTEEKWFDGRIMDALSCFGGSYLISSAAADARRGAAVIVYNRSIETLTDLLHSDGKTLVELALEGQFTLETLLTASRAAQAALHTDSAELVDTSADTAFHGFSYGDKDIFPLYFGLGGNFVTTEADTVSIVSLSALRFGLDTVKKLTGDEATVYAGDTSTVGQSLFEVHTLSEVEQLREIAADIGILPLPKASAEDEYRSYIDLTHTTMLAIPRDAADRQKIEYLVSRMAFLSYGYIEPVLRQQLTEENPDDAQILELISECTACDLSNLFGYGDIGGWLADTVREGEGKLALNYYNRKTLYEKALSIIEKRLIAE